MGDTPLAMAAPGSPSNPPPTRYTLHPITHNCTHNYQPKPLSSPNACHKRAAGPNQHSEPNGTYNSPRCPPLAGPTPHRDTAIQNGITLGRGLPGTSPNFSISIISIVLQPGHSQPHCTLTARARSRARVALRSRLFSTYVVRSGHLQCTRSRRSL